MSILLLIAVVIGGWCFADLMGELLLLGLLVTAVTTLF